MSPQIQPGAAGTEPRTMVFLCIALAVGALFFLFFIRPNDVPAPVPVSPLAHLDDRKQAIYDNLRDLQFEYRLGKLSDADYQQTKRALQTELAVVLAEMEKVSEALNLKPLRSPQPSGTPTKTVGRKQCPYCGAKFAQPLKFCGECGKAFA